MDTLLCATCTTQYFALGQVPCLFPAGVQHKSIWQHQAATMQAQGRQGLAQVQEAVSRYDLTDRTRERLIDTFATLEASQAVTLALLAKAGIEPSGNPQLAQMNAGDLAEYYDLILRDWAWPTEENNAALTRITHILSDRVKPQRILMLGAGAGRLSWDLHCEYRPEISVALDSNPLLLIVADTLIKQRRSFELSEFKTFPQMEKKLNQTWAIEPPVDEGNLRDSWFALGANAWNPPLQPSSFDLIVTPWFIDVNGGDVRDTIGLISHLLAPGGRWVNSGPLLFTRHLPLEQKYHSDEIRDFIRLSGFELEQESVTQVDHLDSPLEVRKQHEQLWTFSAKAPKNPLKQAFQPGAEIPWLIMHHLSIPQYAYQPSQQHPLIHAILDLIDGQRSINEISLLIAPHIPEGITPKDAVVTLMGQIVSEMAS